MFYCHAYSTKIDKLDKAIYFEDDLDNRSQMPHIKTFREESVVIPLPP